MREKKPNQENSLAIIYRYFSNTMCYIKSLFVYIYNSDRPNSVSAECSAEYSAKYSAEAEYSVTVAELTIRLTNFGRKKSFFSENFAFFCYFFFFFPS